MKKGKTETDSAFFNLLNFNRLCDDFLFGDVFQRLDDEVPEGLHALDEQGFVG